MACTEHHDACECREAERAAVLDLLVKEAARRTAELAARIAEDEGSPAVAFQIRKLKGSA